MRWIAFLGRVGCVLLMMSLALGLVFFIPHARMGWSNGGSSSLMQDAFNPLIEKKMLTPRSGVLISVGSNSSVYAYVLKIRTYITWIPGLVYDLSILETFLQGYPDAVLWKSETGTMISNEFFPSSDVNATVVVVNTSSSSARIEWEVSGLVSIAPRDRILILVQIVTPSGIALAAPWIYYSKVKKSINAGLPSS